MIYSYRNGIISGGEGLSSFFLLLLFFFSLEFGDDCGVYSAFSTVVVDGFRFAKIYGRVVLGVRKGSGRFVSIAGGSIA